MRTRVVAVIAFLLLAGGVAVYSASLQQGGPGRFTLDVNGRTRTYLLHIPEERPHPSPLVIMLHWAASSGAELQQFSDFNDRADADGFILAYPDGIGGYWNAQSRTGNGDINFLNALIDHLVETEDVDPERVFVTGISNGGLMTYRVACDMADRITGAAPVIATMLEAVANSCEPARPVAVLSITGVDDPIIPWDGGPIVTEGGGRWLSVLSARDSAAFWAENNGCDDEPPSLEEINADPSDNALARREAYDGCEADVISYSIEGGGHRWPGEDPAHEADDSYLGHIGQDIDAGDVIWDFFVALSS